MLFVVRCWLLPVWLLSAGCRSLSRCGLGVWHSLSPEFCWLELVVSCWLFSPCRLLFTAACNCSLAIADCSSLFVLCSLFLLRCNLLLIVGCCLLFAVGSVPLVTVVYCLLLLFAVVLYFDLLFILVG